ncbi:ABC transporter substrate-binding protein [Vibrio sp.]|nr:ABC transporter substrate-binding protein [Vibrio sp.]
MQKPVFQKLFLPIIFSLIMMLQGCEERYNDHEIRDTGFIFCGYNSPDFLNPQLTSGGITSEAISPQVFDSLLTLDSHTHQPIPNLAKRWEISPDGLTYLFTLRDDVAFQRTPEFSPTRFLNADDVVYSFQRILDTSHPYHTLHNAHYPWFASIGFPTLVNTIEAVTPTQVKITLNIPNNTFLSNLATSFSVIHSKEYAELLIAEDKMSLFDEMPIGTGPFYITNEDHSDFIRLKRHPLYWKTPAKMEQIVFDVSDRGAGNLAKLLGNECDVLHAPNSSNITTLESQNDYNLMVKPAVNVSYLAINFSNPLLADVRVRQALNFAIKRDHILDAVFFGNGEIAYSVLPPSSWAYQQDAVQIRYDRNYAIGLLRDAGVGSGTELNLFIPNKKSTYNPSPDKTAEILLENFADIGITLNILNEDKFNAEDLMDNNNIDLILTGWNADTGDPDNFFRPLLSCESTNLGFRTTSWCNEDFDFLLELALEVDDLKYRRNLYKQAQNMISDAFPIIPLTHGVQFQANHNSLEGFKMSPFNSQPFDEVYRIKEKPIINDVDHLSSSKPSD